MRWFQSPLLRNVSWIILTLIAWFYLPWKILNNQVYSLLTQQNIQPVSGWINQQAPLDLSGFSTLDSFIFAFSQPWHPALVLGSLIIAYFLIVWNRYTILHMEDLPSWIISLTLAVLLLLGCAILAVYAEYIMPVGYLLNILFISSIWAQLMRWRQQVRSNSQVIKLRTELVQTRLQLRQPEKAWQHLSKIPESDRSSILLNKTRKQLKEKGHHKLLESIGQQHTKKTPKSKSKPAKKKSQPAQSKTQSTAINTVQKTSIAKQTPLVKTQVTKQTQIDSPQSLNPVPQFLGSYVVGKIIGRGAMATVYDGHREGDEDKVAIKVLPIEVRPKNPQVKEMQQRFFKEFKVIEKLKNHPHIVRVFAHGKQDGFAYIVMEYLTGKDLSRHTHPDKLLSVEKALEIGIQIAKTLHFTHEQGIIHRDIKPANIIYNGRTRQIKMTDFGVAYLQDAASTRTGTVLGSPSYMPPEQVSGEHVDHRADIYALGVTLFQLMSGILPYSGDSLPEVMYKITKTRTPSLRSVTKRVNAQTSRIIEKSMAKAPSARYSDGEQFAEDLQLALEKY
ncbi:MAG: serine/threonine protein kinase [bacterium]